jgi:hypothetical protein
MYHNSKKKKLARKEREERKKAKEGKKKCLRDKEFSLATCFFLLPAIDASA